MMMIPMMLKPASRTSVQPRSMSALRPFSKKAPFLFCAALFSALFSGTALSEFKISQLPLVADKATDPNLVYIHDDNQFMGKDTMPDDYRRPMGGNANMSAFANKVYYDPDVTYQPPFLHNGSKLIRAKNSDTMTKYPIVCTDGYKVSGSTNACAGTDKTLNVNATNNNTQNDSAVYWDYVPGYSSMRDNPNYTRAKKPEEDPRNYEYYAFRKVPAGALFRTSGASATPLTRTEAENRDLVIYRGCPTLFAEQADGREYYGGLPSSTGAYEGKMSAPQWQKPSDTSRGGTAHAHCRYAYNVWQAHEPGIGQQYATFQGNDGYVGDTGIPRDGGTNYFTRSGNAPGDFNSPQGRVWCERRTGYNDIFNGNVYRPWKPLGTSTYSGHSFPTPVTCYAGRHVIGDTNGDGKYDPSSDNLNAPVSHFEFDDALSKTTTSNVISLSCEKGVCYNLNGAEQSLPHLVTTFVNDQGELDTVSVPRRRTGKEEIRNFMNWYTYYRTRNMMAKAGVSIAFENLIDRNDTSKANADMKGKFVRLGYDTVYSSGMYRSDPTGGGPVYGVVPFRDHPAGERIQNPDKPGETMSNPYAGEKYVKRFYDWLWNITPTNKPKVDQYGVARDMYLHRALNSAGAYLQTRAPWTALPPKTDKGAGDGPIYGCRRSFMVLMAGPYNDYAPYYTDQSKLKPYYDLNNGDADAATPDQWPLIEKKDDNGAVEKTNRNDSTVTSHMGKPPFYGISDTSVGDAKTYPVSGSLADIAMYYWGTDALRGVKNTDGKEVPKKVPPTKKDPAWWSHVQTFTIGLGVQGRLGDGEVNRFLSNPNPNQSILWTFPTGLDIDYELLDDMMHAGLNGHGGTVTAKDAGEFASKLSALMTEIGGMSATSNTSYSGSGSSGKNMNAMVSVRYDPQSWTSTVYNRLYCSKADVGKPGCKAIGDLMVDEKDSQKPGWEAGKLLEDRVKKEGYGSRKIFTWDGKAGASFDSKLNFNTRRAIDAPITRGKEQDTCPFPHATGASCKLGSASPVDYTVDHLIDYLRGDSKWEESASNYSTSYTGFRNRGGALLGDIVNSTPYVYGNNAHSDAGYGAYKCGQGAPVDGAANCAVEGNAFFPATAVASYRKRAAAIQIASIATRAKYNELDKDRDKGTVFVGANDGMLHAFDNVTGKELFAYIPSSVHGRLKQLADPTYEHQYTVDGSPRVRDVLFNNTEWRAVLVGHSGRGGRGFFALDVEEPEKFSANNVLWDFSDENDKDMGYPVDGEGIITAVTGMSTKWAVMFGNGYNSDNHKACLFVITLERSPQVKKICVPEGSASKPNGLGVPIGVETDLTGAISIAYAGDALGNLWKFDLNNFTADKMLTAQSAKNEAQSISAPPLAIVTQGNAGAYDSLQLVIGTGKYFEQADLADPVIQSIYGVLDSSPTATPTAVKRSDLLERTYDSNAPADDEITERSGERPVAYKGWKIAVNEKDDGLGNKKGYVIDFNAPRMDKEKWRVRAQGTMIKSPRHLLVPAVLPGDDPCDSKQDGAIAEINPYTGGWVKDVLFQEVKHKTNLWRIPGSYGMEINRDGKFEKSDITVETTDPKTGLKVYVTLNRAQDGRVVQLGKKPGKQPCGQVVMVSGVGALGKPERCDTRMGRQSWRQIR